MEQNFEFEKPIAEIEQMLQRLKALSETERAEFADQIEELEKKLAARKKNIFQNLTALQTVQIARHPKRPVLQDYLQAIFTDFVELHGDRRFSDDRALVGGFATIEGHKVMVLGHNKGKNVEENIERNFGSARPDGYRKALRLMKLAEKFNIPVVTFIDTAGAFPGKDAEERGQAEAIARNLTEMARLNVPIVAVVTGEGGSGGALGIGVGDVILMLAHSIYSVISPEGCASILWRDQAFVGDAAEALKITAESLKKLGVIDEIIPEPVGGAHTNSEATFAAVKKAVAAQVGKLSKLSTNKLLTKRFEKYSKIGEYATV
jgi:acetyl-CoA carboxylase carboxyl transferase subunit alpha